MAETTDMNAWLREAVGRDAVTTQTEPPERSGAPPTTDAGAGRDTGADQGEAPGEDHPVNTAIRNAFARRS
jgi:hypothetical protein